MELDFTSIKKSFNKYETRYSYFVEKTFKLLNLTFDPIISISFIDNKAIHEINKQYRKIDRPTDVISFAFLDNEDREKAYENGGSIVLGDIYISLDKADEQSKEYGHSLDRELCFLFVHGLLHLLGYDHMKKQDEKIMFDLQDKILEGETFNG